MFLHYKTVKTKESFKSMLISSKSNRKQNKLWLDQGDKVCRRGLESSFKSNNFWNVYQAPFVAMCKCENVDEYKDIASDCDDTVNNTTKISYKCNTW